ncbi:MULTISPECIES: thiol reductant ABC exporter subunit CydC [Vagococcus]|uniref:Transport ATP-binding protein CydC n=1 Tax=Vagococcus fluvialis bH819 TaxID=1255619 RepID=A0A1X6WL38_9ENTE|nr:MULTISPECIES: thiol reductant ABC exporter subunit CydC [Vagococcus]SLM84969.1 Transport ATP-binding protein CydC [Vagococcus fluvialis bH819]HCM88614.1 thiol reductant ABC exporter subunit CydC [Vagococcus sp.]
MKNNYLLLSKEDHWVRPFFKKYKWLLTLVIFLGFLTFFAASALMFTSGYLISRSAAKPENILMVYVPIVLTRAFGIARPTLRYVERLGSHNWVLKMTSDIRLKLYQSMETRAAKSKSEYQTGNILGLLAEDIEHIQNLYLRTIFPAIVALILYVAIVIALGVFSIPLALLMLLLIGVILIILPLTSVLVNNARVYRQKAKKHVLYNQLTDAVLGVGDWQYSGRYQEFLTGYNEAEADVRKEDKVMKQYSRRESLLKQVVFGLIVIVLFVWAGNYFGETGEIKYLNWIAAFVLAFFPLIDAFAPVSDSLKELPLYEDTVRRLSELPSIESVEETTSKVVISVNEMTIQFKDVDFKYSEQQKYLLKGFELTIKQGQVTAVLGKSGVGKTTLSKLLRGDLIPEKGQILINNYVTSELKEQQSEIFGVLNQNPHIFNTTIRNNIRLGNLKATEEEIELAAKQAGLKPVYDKLPLGLDTLVEESGKRFSGGEQQRIALARILLQDAPIIVIDEPTIGLDPITEKQLLETVFSVLKGKTVLWITHHLVGTHYADQIVFLEEGKISMLGTQKELLANNDKFKKLYQLDLYE